MHTARGPRSADNTRGSRPHIEYTFRETFRAVYGTVRHRARERDARQASELIHLEESAQAYRRGEQRLSDHASGRAVYVRVNHR